MSQITYVCYFKMNQSGVNPCGDRRDSNQGSFEPWGPRFREHSLQGKYKPTFGLLFDKFGFSSFSTKKYQHIWSLLYENLLSNLVALVARGGRWLRSCRLDISCPIDTQKVTSCLLRRPKVVLGQSMFSFSSIDYIGTYIEKHTYPYYPYHLPSERIGSYLLPRKRSNDI